MAGGSKSVTTRNPSPERAAATLVDRLLDEVVSDGCVAFIGAGSTTEKYGGVGFYKLIQRKCGYPDEHPRLSFPQLMEYFCAKQDGGQQNRLIREAIDYIQDFCAAGEMNRVATMTPRLLAGIPHFRTIVTTNWDPFLERSLDVLTPVVQDRDMAFWDDRRRQILKIHGCISRPYTIVATESDYRGAPKENELIFNKLRDLMATKTFIFLGYSMRDADFRELWAAITTRLGKFTRRAYAVSPNASPEDVEYWDKRGIEVVRVFDGMFLRKLRERLEKDGFVPTRSFLSFLAEERKRIVDIHINLSQNSAGGFASSMYQDGLLHELDHVLDAAQLGTKRRRDFEDDRADAKRNVAEAKRLDNIVEVAYWTGRYTAADYYCDQTKKSIPKYLHPESLVPTSRLVKGETW